ncbi:hypothetical protein NIES25_47430 [Nostoc linckia NIES-25]|nr:hypothetical protein NIES25_47430 [Nostoc linckia NIES-25]
MRYAGAITHPTKLFPTRFFKTDMEREIKDSDGITWTCIQAFSGVSDSAEAKNAAQVNDEPNTYWVVCTPSGGAQSVRLKLKDKWEENYSDEELLQEIKTQQ